MKQTNSPARVIGTTSVVDGIGVVRAESRYDTDAADLWEALTAPERLARWIADITGTLEVGGSFEAAFTSGWSGPGRVEHCEPPHHLRVALSPGTTDETTISAWLTADGDGVHLAVEERGIPVDDLPEHGAGWQAHLEDLDRELAGTPEIQWSTRWAELRPVYRARPATER